VPFAVPGALLAAWLVYPAVRRRPQQQQD
jgi:hypothetical protein